MFMHRLSLATKRRALVQAAAMASDDAHEGMQAFLDKRAPQFTHR